MRVQLGWICHELFTTLYRSKNWCWCGRPGLDGYPKVAVAEVLGAWMSTKVECVLRAIHLSRGMRVMDYTVKEKRCSEASLDSTWRFSQITEHDP